MGTLDCLVQGIAVVANSDEFEPSWFELGLNVNNFQLGLARDLFHLAWKFPYEGSKISLID